MALLRIGLIGFGAWAREAYVPALLEDPDVEVVAVAARSEQTHDAARDVLGSKLQHHTDYRRMLAEADVEAVMIGVPSEASPAAALAAVEAGVHVFVEPPLAQGETTDRLLPAASQGDDVFHVDLEGRYLPAVDAVRDVVHREGFGTLNAVTVELDNNWANEWGNPGMVTGLSTWYVDFMDYLIERSPEEAEVVGADEQVGQATMSYPGGVEGVWRFNLRTGGELSFQLTVAGEDGTVHADLMTGEYRWQLGGDSGSGNAPSRPSFGFVGMRESVQAFLSAVRGEGETRSGPEVYERVHKTIGALKRSWNEGSPVKV